MELSASVRENVPLAPLTTLGIGGPAQYFVEAACEDAVVAGLAFASSRDLPIFVLGGGSNLLISDEGFAGLVIHIALRGVTFAQNGQFSLVKARAGENWDHLVEACVSQDLAGIECLSGIPGSVGGTPVQNVGAYGQEVSDVIDHVRAFDRVERRIVELPAAACGFAYRSSILNTTARDRFVVLEVTYRLTLHGPPTLRYADIRDCFSGSTETPSLGEVRNAVIAIRAHKGMILHPHDPDSQSAGSFFKNPIVTAAALQLIREFAPTVPAIPLPDGNFKVPAAWLIERAGFRRGDSRGPVGISTKHSLSLVNRGNATARDVLELANEIRAVVRREFNIKLELEPVLVSS